MSQQLLLTLVGPDFKYSAVLNLGSCEGLCVTTERFSYRFIPNPGAYSVEVSSKEKQSIRPRVNSIQVIFREVK